MCIPIQAQVDVCLDFMYHGLVRAETVEVVGFVVAPRENPHGHRVTVIKASSSEFATAVSSLRNESISLIGGRIIAIGVRCVFPRTLKYDRCSCRQENGCAICTQDAGRELYMEVIKGWANPMWVEVVRALLDAMPEEVDAPLAAVAT